MRGVSENTAVTDLSELRFFQTAEHSCGYLPAQQASNVFIDPGQNIDAGLYSVLSEFGFRRSGDHIYRPHCAHCQACIPYRIIVDEFFPNRSQKRCLKKNQSLKIQLVDRIDGDEYYALYERYINERHSDGDMHPASREQYDGFLSSEWGVTRYIAMRDPDGTLVSVAVCDVLRNGLSAMYSFFEPAEEQRSLGVFNILYQIHWARELGLPFLYLGYWIADCRKMRYKQDYRPYQLFTGNQWRTFHE